MFPINIEWQICSSFFHLSFFFCLFLLVDGDLTDIEKKMRELKRFVVHSTILSYRKYIKYLCKRIRFVHVLMTQAMFFVILCIKFVYYSFLFFHCCCLFVCLCLYLYVWFVFFLLLYSLSFIQKYYQWIISMEKQCVWKIEKNDFEYGSKIMNIIVGRV